MVHKFAIFCNTKDAAEMLLKRVHKNIECDNITFENTSDGNYVIICIFERINKMPQSIKQDISKTMNLDSLGYVIDYGFIKSEYNQQITINMLNANKGISY